ncbi:MAG: DUF6745 domain-containing protein [Hyphomicrobiaceae bacterium]
MSWTRNGTEPWPHTTDLAAFRERWHAASLSARPVDRSATESAVEQAYQAAGQRPPREIVWCRGPVGLSQSWNAARLKGAPGRNLRNVIFDRTRKMVHAQLENHLDIAAQRLVTRPPNGGVAQSVGRAVTRMVHAATERFDPDLVTTLRRFVFDHSHFRVVVERLRPFAWSGYSQYEISWTAGYQFLHDACGLRPQTQPLMGHWTIAANVGWILPHEQICWLAERPIELLYDDRGRPHNGDGPAITYPDGWMVYAWKGVRVPASVVLNRSSLTIDDVERESNVTVRRCMIEIITPERFVALGGARLTAQDETGILWRKSWPDGDNWAAVEVVNGTALPDGSRTHYFIQVPPDLWTPRAAVAWTYGMSEKQYRQLVLRT